MKLFILMLLFFYSCTSINRLYVPFAGVKEQIESNNPNDTVIRVYFDRNGFIYPKFPTGITISNQEFRNAAGLLSNFYKTNPADYSRICSNYGATPTPIWDNITAANEPLQEKLIDYNIQRINDHAAGRTIVFTIHGFNDHPTKPKVNNSVDENRWAREGLTGIFSNRLFLFVEIYWDGLSAENGPHWWLATKSNSFKIWDNAQASAAFSGLELRRILAGLNADSIKVITHSHGAAIITSALFNVQKFRSVYASNPRHWLYELTKRYDNKKYDSPTQHFSVGMLVPAIPGVNVFNEYYDRTIGGTNTKTNNYNYDFTVGFNSFDEVTTKFGFGARHFGSTTLSCMMDELIRTQGLFLPRTDIMGHVDFSYYTNHKKLLKHRKHAWKYYLDHKPQSREFFIEVLR